MLEVLRNVSLLFLFNLAVIVVTLHRILTIKRDATAAVAWSLGVLLVPLLGATLFWTMGDPTVRRTLKRVVHGPPIYQAAASRYGKRRRRVREREQLMRLLERLAESPPTEGNEVEFMTDGAELYDRLAEDLRNAHHEICFQFYIIRRDATGEMLAEILRERARAGVRVFFLYDAIGSNRLGEGYLKRLRRCGVRCLPFLPFKPLRRRVQLNFRNHRKLVVIDREIAYTGGMNVGEEYAGRHPRHGRWYDVHMRVTGPAVPQLLDEFAADWIFASGKKKDPFPANAAWFQPVYPAPQPGVGQIQTVSSGPDQEVNRMHSNVLFGSSRAQERLWIATPYFVPDNAILAVLHTAALAGMDVRVVTQGDKPDKWLPYFGARYFWAPLLQHGVRIYQIREGMMHAKMMLADNKFATAGSANLDVRSLALNFELNLNFYSRREIREIESLFERLFEECVEVTYEEFEERPLGARVLENISRLFAPAL